MAFSTYEIREHIRQEVAKKTAMCRPYKRRPFPLDGFWKPHTEPAAASSLKIAPLEKREPTPPVRRAA